MTTRPPALPGQLGDADLRLLRIFRKVAECGGFAAAEVELNISRAAISMAMNDLENRLSLKLCQRGRSGFALTDEGQEVYDASLQLLTAVEGFRTRVNGLHSQLRGELNIGITDNLVTIPEMHITNALRALKRQGPEVRVNIRMIPPKNIERGVLEGSLHVGVVPAIRTLAGLHYRPLYEERSELFCSDAHPLFAQARVDASRLEGVDAVLPAYAQSAAIRSLYEGLRAAASATDREGVAFLILSGEYVGYLPTHYAQRWVEAGRMRAVNPERCYYVTNYSAITRKGAPPNLIMDCFLEQLERGVAG
jgi:DNA-binding transcriptional LysR family regulator